MSESWRDRAVVWPIGPSFVALAIVTGVIAALGLWWADPGRAPTVPIVGGVFGGVFYSGFMSLFVYLARRRERATTGELSPAARIDVNRALRIGEAPREPANDQAALALIDRRRTQAKGALKLSPWVWGLLLAIAAINVVTQPSVFHVLSLALYLVLVATLVVSTRRRLARLDQADQAIRARATVSDA